MPQTKSIAVKDLKLDLHNFRTVPQSTEAGAIDALITANPDWFWALMGSLLDDGYLANENILVSENGTKATSLIVREGNRRIAALKLIFGFVRRNSFALPSDLEAKIQSLTDTWKAANKAVPCRVYQANESAEVDKIITRIHGKGEKTGRDPWSAVARARHNRDKSGVNEPALDLLESYLTNGKNLTAQEKILWAGDYPLTVLDEAVKRLVPRLGYSASRELVDAYPKAIKQRSPLEEILRDIGGRLIGFADLRNTGEDVLQSRYQIAPLPQSTGTGATVGSGGTSTTTQTTSTGPASTGSTSGTTPSGAPSAKARAVATNDPRSVKLTLRQFAPRGAGREKVVTLLIEARRLKLDENPLAFCFLLRSMFEIAAKAYCVDHQATGGPAATKPDGNDRSLVDVLRDITNHLTNGKKDRQMTKHLHGAMAEIGRADGLLSVTSMNQLVHHPKFSVTAGDISALFHNIFPLLEAMNR